MNKFLFQLLLLQNKSSILVGGQAVMEGVMMRVPGAYATAVRDNEGNIQIDRHEFKSIVEVYPFLKKPIIRGIIGLFESLRIGYSTLQWSAEIITSEEKSSNKSNKLLDIIITLISLFLAVSLFFVAPIGLTSWLFDKDHDAFIFNLISGIFRVVFFITYLVLISLMKDVHRLFQYHGAEHKTVYNFEAGTELTVSNAQQFPTQHPRCGTSFLFIIMIVAILSFALLDSALMLYINELTIWMRFVFHIPFGDIVNSQKSSRLRSSSFRLVLRSPFSSLSSSKVPCSTNPADFNNSSNLDSTRSPFSLTIDSLSLEETFSLSCENFSLGDLFSNNKILISFFVI